MAKQRIPYDRMDQSFKDIFRDLSLRSDKNSFNSSEFSNRISHDPLWSHRWCSLSWIHEELRRRDMINIGIINELSPREEDSSFVALIKSCGENKDLEKGATLHIHLLKRGLLDNKPYLACSLICMYTKCSMFDEALQVLEDYRIQTVYTWNALIVGYAKKGLGQEALNCFEKMQSHEGLSPDVVTFTCILKACGKVGAINKGEQIHGEIVKKGFLEKDVVLGNALVDMYAKCGILVKAKQVLEDLPVRDVVSWNALIAGYVQQGQGQEALNCLEHMQSEGLYPDSVTFICTLKACGIARAIDKGRQIHDEIVRRHMLAKDVLLGTALINMYSKCGMLAKAQEVLKELPFQNAATWNALIAGCVEQGKSEEALKYYVMMQKQDLPPDAITFICILKACGGIGALAQGKDIHEKIVSRGLLKKDVVLGTALVDMYAKCGELAKAQQVLEGLPVRDVVTWNALLVGYALQEQHNATLNCFEQMKTEGCTPNVVTLVCVLKSCGCTRAIDKGEKIHDSFFSMGVLEKDTTVGAALVDMYAKCGMLVKAKEVLMDLPARDVVSWNALVAGYVQHGQCHEALNCFEQMRKEGCCPDASTFICALKSCGSIGAIDRGKQLHDEIMDKFLLNEDIALSNALIDMYAKCGMLAQAQQLLEELPNRQLVSWNALISGYAQHGHGHEAWNCFTQMQSEGLCPSVVTFVCILKACGSVNGIDKGRQIHNMIVGTCLLENNVLGNALVDMYVKCGVAAKAREVLEMLPVRDAISWNTLISGYVQQGQSHEALKCFKRMQYEDISPNVVTFLCILKACSIIGDIDKGKQIHYEIVKRSLLEKNTVLVNALVDMYSKCGALEKAQELFEELHVRDVASWSALIAGYAQQDQCQEALNCFEQMQNEGISPDVVTLICILKVCAATGAIEKGREIHDNVVSQHLLDKDIMLGTALVDMYAKCKMPEKAQQVLEKLPLRDVVCWNALIAGYAQQGKCHEALNCFQLMQSEGVSPDVVTFICILKACGNVGSIDKGMQIHVEIVSKRLLEKDIVLGNTLVGMYAKCGILDKAYEVLRELPVQDVVSWNALIGGYVQQGCSQAALDCFERMQNGKLSPDVVTFICILKACGTIGAINKGKQIHEDILTRGLLEKEILLGNALIDMYARCGMLGKAVQVLDELAARDTVSWNALIAGFAQQGQGQEALKCFEHMQSEGLIPDEVTCLCILSACSHSGLLDEAQNIFNSMMKKFGISPSSEHHTCMLVVFGCAGQFEKALSMVTAIPPVDHLVAWLALLGACQKWGNVELGKLVFDQALKSDSSCAAAYVLMANLFSVTGMHEDAHKVESMRLKYAASEVQENNVDIDGRGILYWIDRYF